MSGPIDVALKFDALIKETHAVCEAEYLITAAVGEDGMLRPPLKIVQAAESGDGFMTGTQKQMVRVCEDEIVAHLFKFAMPECLDRGARTHRHEDGRAYQQGP